MLSAGWVAGVRVGGCTVSAVVGKGRLLLGLRAVVGVAVVFLAVSACGSAESEPPAQAPPAPASQAPPGAPTAPEATAPPEALPAEAPPTLEKTPAGAAELPKTTRGESTDAGPANPEAGAEEGQDTPAKAPPAPEASAPEPPPSTEPEPPGQASPAPSPDATPAELPADPGSSEESGEGSDSGSSGPVGAETDEAAPAPSPEVTPSDPLLRRPLATQEART